MPTMGDGTKITNQKNGFNSGDIKRVHHCSLVVEVAKVNLLCGHSIFM